MQVQTSEQTFFNFIISGISRFPPIKFYSIDFWSNSYERRLMFKRSWVWIPTPNTRTFFTIILTYVVKLYCLFQKTENKRKKGRRCSLGQKPRFLSDFKGTNYNREAVIRLFEGLLRSIEIIFCIFDANCCAFLLLWFVWNKFACDINLL